MRTYVRLEGFDQSKHSCCRDFSREDLHAILNRVDRRNLESSYRLAPVCPPDATTATCTPSILVSEEWVSPAMKPVPDDVRLLPERLHAPLSWKKPRRVFVNSMSDVFHPKVPFDFVVEMFLVMQEASRRGHIFQILTKRPGRAVAWWGQHEEHFPGGWPAGIWMGTSVESQKFAPRLTVLARLPAPVRFVSAEPLLDRLDLTEWLEQGVLQWVIVGGESGAGARAMDPDWARALRDQTVSAGVAFFLKQLGGVRDKRGGKGATIDGKHWRQNADHGVRHEYD